MEKVYNVGDLKKIIAESSEFQANIGSGVESGNKTEAGKAYKDAKKRAKDFDGGGNEEYWKPKKTSYKKDDYNGTMLDYEPDNVDDKYKKRVEAQVKGYTSEDEMNNKEEKAADFSDNKAIYDGIKTKGKEMHKEKADKKKTGLQAREMPADTFKKEEMYENVKTAYFKKTQFLSEEHMYSRIPDEFKFEGNTFMMKDKDNNSYLLEWKNNNPHIISHVNKNGLDESINRMKQLMGYSYHDTSSKQNTKMISENENIENTLNRMRDLMK